MRAGSLWTSLGGLAVHPLRGIRYRLTRSRLMLSSDVLSTLYYTKALPFSAIRCRRSITNGGHSSIQRYPSWIVPLPKRQVLARGQSRKEHRLQLFELPESQWIGFLVEPAIQVRCECLMLLSCPESSRPIILVRSPLLINQQQYKIESGKEHVKTYKDTNTDSGSSLDRNFCSNCGSTLSIQNTTNPKMKDNIVICAGTIDDNYKDFMPQSELFPQRRHAWIPELKKKSSKPKM